MTDTLTLGGRQFRRATNSTFAHDITLMNHVRASGVFDVPIPGMDGDFQAYAEQMLERAATYPRFGELMGCLLLPPDTTWSPAVCRESGDHLAGLTALEDKELLRSILVDLLLSFFVRGHE